ncbi:ankyrin repeat-containing domain protein [Aspergillus filifer]
MSLLSLPTELQFLIATDLHPKDIDSLIRIHSFFHSTLSTHLITLYQTLHDSPSSALYAASNDRSEFIVNHLLNSGVDIRQKSLYWTCTFLWAYAKHHRRLNSQGGLSFQPQAISAAARNEYIEIVLNFLSHRADVNFKDINWRSPLSLAAAGWHINTAKALIANGANILSIDKDRHRAIALAASADLLGKFCSVKLAVLKSIAFQ